MIINTASPENCRMGMRGDTDIWSRPVKRAWTEVNWGASNKDNLTELKIISFD